MWDISDEAQSKRDERASKVKDLSEKYLDLYVRHIGADKVTLYLHVVHHHAPTMIRRVGSLSRWSMQPIEHRHSLRKKQHRLACNHKKKGALGKFRKDGTQSVVSIGYHTTMLSTASLQDQVDREVPERTTKTIQEGERKKNK